MTEPLWKLVVSGLPAGSIEQLSDIVDNTEPPLADVTAIDIDPVDNTIWRLEIYCPAGADQQASVDAVSALAEKHGLRQASVQVVTFEDEDWVAKVQSDLSPVTAGRFYVHGSHDRGRVAGNSVAIEIDAAQAFGTGHHGTTAGCLKALNDLLKHARPRSVLDVGCGSGVLAIAAARVLRSPTIAADIDPLAVAVAAGNVHLNGVHAQVRTAVAAGTRHRMIHTAAPFDLVFANILARPLQALAPEICSVLAPGGRAILSGLTHSQEARVLSAYRLQDTVLEKRIRLAGWSTLTLRKSSSGQRGFRP